ncbi:MAG: hypothetical protein LUD39_04130 [Opitutae bacterium]|nr:hypothetical protein [Opitutae bacterium]MCD8298930.1 hypothetical protein [Opitutae bacterium]
MFSLDRVSVGDKITAENWNKLVDAVNELNETVKRQRIAPSDDFIMTEDSGGTMLELRGRASDGDDGVYVPPFKVSAKIENGKLKATVAPGTIWTKNHDPATYTRFAGDDVEEDVSAGGFFVCLKFQVYLSGDKESYVTQLEENIDYIDPDKTNDDGSTSHDDNIAVIQNCLKMVASQLDYLIKRVASTSIHSTPELEIVSSQEFRETDDWSLGDEYTYHHYVLASITVAEGGSGSLSISKKTQICGGDIWFDPVSLKLEEQTGS